MATDALNRPIRGIDTGNIAPHHQPWDQETFQHIQVPGPSLESSQTGRILAVFPARSDLPSGKYPFPPLPGSDFPGMARKMEAANFKSACRP